MRRLDRGEGIYYNAVSANGNANNHQDPLTIEPMTRRITMTDVAREAGVSLMTVSRVVNQRTDVSSSTREKVLDVIERLGYRPSSIARGLVTKHTSTLGIIVPDIANPFFAALVRGAEHQAYAEGYNVFLCNTDEDPKREVQVLTSLEEKRVDGVLLVSSRLTDTDLRAAIDRFPTAVLISRRVPGAPAGTVLIDDELGGFLAAQHLLGSGHRAIGLITGPQISFSAQNRMTGYSKALADAGFSFLPEWVQRCAPTVEQGYEKAQALLAATPELTALICHNDLVAVGALHACAKAGKSVPDDVAVVGYDDIPLASFVRPALTTLHVPIEELGIQAMQLLLDQIYDRENADREIILAPRLVIRESAPDESLSEKQKAVSHENRETERSAF